MEEKLGRLIGILGTHTNVLDGVIDTIKDQTTMIFENRDAVEHNAKVLDATIKKLNKTSRKLKVTRVATCVLAIAFINELKSQQRKIDKLQKEIDEMKGE